MKEEKKNFMRVYDFDFDQHLKEKIFPGEEEEIKKV